MAIVAIAVVAVVAVTELGSSSHQRTIYASFASATNLVPGARVTAGGATVGSVGTITLDGAVAVVALHISSNAVWPLHVGTTADIRWGGTLSYSNRYVELMPGSTRNAVLKNNQRLPTADTVTPVEFDQLFDVFNGSTRASLGDLIGNGAQTFSGAATPLHNGIAEAAPALTSVSGVLQQLGEDPHALETLISAGASTADALHSEQPELANLVSSAGNTFDTIATNAHGTQETLAQLSPALKSADIALDRLDPTLTKLNTVVNEIRPGAVALKQLASPLNDALTELNTVAPQLNSTLAVVQTGAPKVTSLLNTARPVLTAAKSTLNTAEPMVACVLPYGPEVGGFIETWQSFLSGYDTTSHYARALFQAFPAIDDSTQTPSQLVSGDSSLGYALVRPPGYNANEAWDQDTCGASNGLTAADDPENP
jgi:virulence factor Mce-like protein